MNIVFQSRDSSFTAPYLSVSLLRDNVQHHLQHGRLATGYVLLHAIAELHSPMHEELLALELWEEISMACSGLANLPADQVAISIRTRGLMNGSSSVPPVNGTVIARDVDWAVPVVTDGKVTLAELFSDIREGIGGVTRFGAEAGCLQIVRSNGEVCLAR